MSRCEFYTGEWAMPLRSLLILTLGAAVAVAAQAPAALSVQPAVASDTSAPLAQMLTTYHPPAPPVRPVAARSGSTAPGARRQPPPPPVPDAAAAIEQARMGAAPALPLAASFDGLGAGFTGPQGTARFRNPSDNSLAVGPDEIIQTVNSQLAIFDKTGKALYGPVET